MYMYVYVYIPIIMYPLANKRQGASGHRKRASPVVDGNNGDDDYHQKCLSSYHYL